MAFSGVLFVFWRLAQFVTLIPIVGMLAWFVDGYVDSNQLTPNSILILFIVSVLAVVWALFTLIGYARARHSGLFVALVDLAFVGAFIAGVYELRGVTDWDCANATDPGAEGLYLDLGVFGYYGVAADSPWAVDINKNCAMLKACFALGIMNTVFFFFTFLLALLVARHHRDEDRTSKRSSRHSNRRSRDESYYRGSSGHRTHRSSRRPHV